MADAVIKAVGITYHVLPHRRVPSATKWHPDSTEKSRNPPVCFWLLTLCFFWRIRASIMSWCQAYLHRCVEMLLSTYDVYRFKTLSINQTRCPLPLYVREYNRMAQTLLEMAKDLTRTLVEAGHLAAEDMPHTLQSTYTTLATLKVQEEAGTSPSMPSAEPTPVDWRKSITRHAVTCLVCGDTFKQLSIRHLSMHGLDTRSYRTQYGIPRTQPLSARATTQRRRQVAQTLRPWERTSTYRKGQTRHGTALPEPKAEILPEATEAPHPVTSAQPKRQRQTTLRKNASPKTSAPG